MWRWYKLYRGVLHTCSCNLVDIAKVHAWVFTGKVSDASHTWHKRGTWWTTLRHGSSVCTRPVCSAVTVMLIGHHTITEARIWNTLNSSGTSQHKLWYFSQTKSVILEMDTFGILPALYNKKDASLDWKRICLIM